LTARTLNAAICRRMAGVAGVTLRGVVPDNSLALYTKLHYA
jgi:hypothetical protein